MNNSNLMKAYASYFVSYLLSNLKNSDNILRIILFGSVAQGREEKESDVDIFIEVKRKSKKFEKKIDELLEDFYVSREGLLFKSRGIENEFHLISGRLKDWKELKQSIDSTGIVLYGHYISDDKISGKKYALFSWDKIKKNRGAFLNKLYGFKSHDKIYVGLIETLGGKKIGKSSIMIPIEHQNEIVKLFKYYGVSATVLDVWME